LCSRADVIVLHCSLTKENQQFIDKKAIAKMKKNAIIINNARGQLINEKDLADALNEGRIYAAGIDVVSKEPIEKDNPLLKAKNCYITPHMSWGSVEARKRIMDMTYENIQGYLNDKTVNRIV
jgi:glycerate dehydrogenase